MHRKQPDFLTEKEGNEANNRHTGYCHSRAFVLFDSVHFAILLTPMKRRYDVVESEERWDKSIMRRIQKWKSCVQSQNHIK